MDELTAFKKYCEGQMLSICPFLAPALKAGLLHTILCDVNVSKGNSSAEAEIFWTAYRETLDFVVQRENLPTNRCKNLICKNVVHRFSESVNSERNEALLLWPHWILKKIFSRHGIMFGKFWFMEELTLQNGEEMPKPPVSFISIRSFIDVPDKTFISNQPEVLLQLEGSSKYRSGLVERPVFLNDIVIPKQKEMQTQALFEELKQVAA